MYVTIFHIGAHIYIAYMYTVHTVPIVNMHVCIKEDFCKNELIRNMRNIYSIYMQCKKERSYLYRKERMGFSL
jgi:hypothetical protein